MKTLPPSATSKESVLLAVLACIVLSTQANAVPSAPFTQAPPVGFDTSAGILIYYDGNRIRIFQDLSQGPYDHSDDTLIGVQNDSVGTLFAVTLTGTSSPPIFGFDGDGQAVYTGVFYGPTGYEGPGTYFSDISADENTGTVNFVGGIEPGGSAWFSLESDIQSAKGPLMSTPTQPVTIGVSESGSSLLLLMSSLVGLGLLRRTSNR